MNQTAPLIRLIKKTKTSEMKKMKRRLNLELFLLALPGMLIVFTFHYLPLPGIIVAFKSIQYDKGIFGSPWTGFDNFKFLFLTDIINRITRNTVLINLMFILFGTIFCIATALMLFEITKRILVKIYQTIIIFPHFLSWVVVAFMFYGLINSQYGLINKMTESLGWGRVDWYSTPEIWPLILLITHIWKAVGMGSVIYYASLMGIDREYYEAAEIDGATKWQQTIYISIPFLVPLVIILTILSLGNIIRADFGMFYYLTKDVPVLYSTTDVVDTYVYRALRSLGDPGMAGAAGLYQSVVGFVLIMTTNLIIKKIRPGYELF